MGTPDAIALQSGQRLERRRLVLRGAVQGVGFRPTCLRLAREAGLSGWVRNDAGGLVIEAQGEGGRIAAFFERLIAAPPPLARIDAVERDDNLAVDAGEADFVIVATHNDGPCGTGLPADAGICPDCLSELLDPNDRRYRYPFINCTQCGPRFTIVRSLPYDRPATSMAAFAQCPACTAEYSDPENRRHHAQPNACPDCGPRLDWRAFGDAPVSDDPLRSAVETIRAGGIVALQGVGGFQLVCDAQQPHAVERLRARKQRPAKPFAVMAANPASLRRWLLVDAAAAGLLETPARPIVLLPRRAGLDDGPIAPGLDEWGALLPASPLHWLLLHEALGRPAGTDWTAVEQTLLWVATSANPAGEPLVATPEAAFAQLADIADGVLFHDRNIVARCDDSVRRPGGQGGFPFVRRARGYVPDPIAMPGVDAQAPAVVGFGGWLKNTVCVTRGNEAFLSPHVGDLASVESCRAHDEALQRLLDFLGVKAAAIAHDRHPDFYSTRRALAFADAAGIPAFAVQHHHAHLAAVAAEHGFGNALDGLMLDGTGLGDDGSSWGGEYLRLKHNRFDRVGHLAALGLPGGDAAAREPWRCAAAVLHALGRGDEIVGRFSDQPAAATVARLLDAGRQCPPTTAAGRVFDAAAALLGLCSVHRFEADAAMQLEAWARRADEARCIESAWSIRDGVLSLDGLWQHLAAVDRENPQAVAQAAADFHRTLGVAFVALLGTEKSPEPVALGGGCLINREFHSALVAELSRIGRPVLEARQAPCGDGGLALGQAWVALHAFEEN